jgi:cold shock CspA family protein
MENGTVCNLQLERGFGFIRTALTNDVFFHCKSLNDLDFDETLLERRVSFEMTSTQLGPRAVDVRAAE